ncbi:hypothetical protein ACNS7O_02055 [Haloferacaceae archaeon DSL9]
MVLNIADELEAITSRSTLDRLSLLSLVADAGYALYRGRTTVALLTLCAAVVAVKWSWVSFAAQGALTLFRLSKRLD